MTPLRFVHAADLHLDSPFKGLQAVAPEQVADTLFDATFRAYEKIVELCISERADALLIAGDVYDGVDRSLRAQRKFVEGLERLHAANIRSFVCHGNHDPLDGWEARLAYPPGCHRFGAEFEAVPVFENDPDRAIVYGVSYPHRNVTENLVSRLGRVKAGPFSIGLLHANVGNHPGHAPYAPCSLDDLLRAGVDYWALGHVHTRHVLHEQEPAVVYPGNPQGRNPIETGARGAYLATARDDGKVDLEFRAVDCVRWECSVLDISPLEDEQALLDALDNIMQELLDGAGGRPVIARITLEGRGELNRSLGRADMLADLVEQINEAWTGRNPFAWCERIENLTAPEFDRNARFQGTDFLAEVLRTADRAKADPELRERLRTGMSSLYQHNRFRRYLAEAVPNEEELAALASEAEMMAVNLLAGDGA